MDKRYVLILIIILGCCINLFIISNSSDLIGSASVECGNYIFTMPQEFSLYRSDINHVLLHDSKTGMYVDVYSQLPAWDTYDNKVKEITKEGFTILSNGTIDVEGIGVKTIYYTNDEHQNRSTFFFEKDNNQFRVLMNNFNMDNDRNDTINYIVKIVETTTYNYKR